MAGGDELQPFVPRGTVIELAVVTGVARQSAIESIAALPTPLDRGDHRRFGRLGLTSALNGDE